MKCNHLFIYVSFVIDFVTKPSCSKCFFVCVCFAFCLNFLCLHWDYVMLHELAQRILSFYLNHIVSLYCGWFTVRSFCCFSNDVPHFYSFYSFFFVECIWNCKIKVAIKIRCYSYWFFLLIFFPLILFLLLLFIYCCRLIHVVASVDVAVDLCCWWVGRAGRGGEKASCSRVIDRCLCNVCRMCFCMHGSHGRLSYRFSKWPFAQSVLLHMHPATSAHQISLALLRAFLYLIQFTCLPIFAFNSGPQIVFRQTWFLLLLLLIFFSCMDCKLCVCVYFIVITTILLLYLLFLKEVVGCSSCNMWLTTTRSWIELKAIQERKLQKWKVRIKWNDSKIIA